METIFKEGDVKKLKTLSAVHYTCIKQPLYVNQFKYFNEELTISGVVDDEHFSQPRYFIKEDNEEYKYYEEWFIP